MPDTSRVATHLGNGRPVAEIHARRDELLERIEDEDLIPEWCWHPMMETVGRLSRLGDDVAWIVTAYLSSVVVRGPKLFDPAAKQLALNAVDDTLPCRCGNDAPADPLIRRSGRLVRTARCSCGLDLVRFDEEPHPGPTLISSAFV